MYKNILVPLDGSKTAEIGLPGAVDLALYPGAGATITLFRVIEIYPLLADDKKAEQKTLELEARDYLNDVKKGIEAKGIKVQLVIKSGKPAREICDYANENPIDLVVMTSHGMGGALSWALGSVSEKVIRHCFKPVLISSCRECKVSY